MKMNPKYILTAVVVMMIFLQSCQDAGFNSTGSEFMPDMGHSVAYEANYYNYYYNNTWGTEDEYYEYAQPRLPVENTVPRSISTSIPIPNAVKVAGYPYDDSEEGRTQAMNEIIDNPLRITDAGLEKGEELYDIFCATCHGDKGDGNGYLVRDDGGVYPVQPANLISDEFINASNGRFYHSIMHGRNLMGPYRDKLNVDERWQVIHYIRALQAKEKGLEYNQYANTLNDIDMPAGDLVVEEESDMELPGEDAGMHMTDDHSEINHENASGEHEGHGHGDDH